MKIRPIILCGGAGTRLWPESKNRQAKQFIDFGGWTLLEKTLSRVKSSIFDYPIISTNLKYVKKVKFFLRKANFKNYKIILEPSKKNTAPAILTSSLLVDIPDKQPLIFLPSDHLLENVEKFNQSIFKIRNKLNENNIFIFGIKPSLPSSEYGYFLTRKTNNNLNKVIKFIEKPKINKAKKIIKRKGYLNAGIFFARKDSILHNFKKYQPLIYRNCLKAILKSKSKHKICHLNKFFFDKSKTVSFDYAILEKSKEIYGIMLNILWSDLGSWREISKIYNREKLKYYKSSNVFYRPWGSYVNLFKGKDFLVKELIINSKSSISLQKHHHRSEHWMITSGMPRITINKDKFFKKINDTVFVPKGSIHRIENLYKRPVKIIEVQTGNILKETDIVRFQDIYGRVK